MHSSAKTLLDAGDVLMVREEEQFQLDDDSDPLRHRLTSYTPRPDARARRRALMTMLVAVMACIAGLGMGVAGQSGADAGLGGSPAGNAWTDYLPPSVLMFVCFLLTLSAFFSSSETAFLSIPLPRLRSMREEHKVTSRLVVRMLDNPGRLLTTILVGNMLVNIIIGVVLGSRVKNLFESMLGWPTPAAYVTAIAVTTSVLLFFGEITPKVFAVRAQESYARLAAIPLRVTDRFLAPLRDSLIRITDFLFLVTRFHELHAAPFITDEELKSALAGEEASGAIEEEGREMIRRILEFSDVTVGKILVPRTDVVALPEDATVAAALELYRKEEYSRMPVYEDDLDHIVGVLFAKDLLPSVAKGELDRPVRTLAHPPHFVPQTMSVQAFVKDAQRLRSHLAVVVDEYGGTEGLVTLQDALEEVVGDIQEEGEKEEVLYEQIADGVYRVHGSMPLDELSELVGISLEGEEHNTVAGFVMERSDKVPEIGDRISHSGVVFTVEEVEGKWASSLRIEVPARGGEGVR